VLEALIGNSNCAGYGRWQRSAFGGISFSFFFFKIWNTSWISVLSLCSDRGNLSISLPPE
jgi:hypothetical protein